MDIAEKIRNFLAKLQNLPEDRKKTILWSIVAILAIIMGVWWFVGFKNALPKITGGLQQIELPKIETPEMPQIDLDELEKEMKADIPAEEYNELK
jgi:hypothetical protein